MPNPSGDRSTKPVVMEFRHDTFISPLTWRYGSDEMRQLWSEEHKRRLLRRFWVALAESQAACGIVSAAQVNDLREHQDDIDLARAAAIESDVKHDLMAEVMTYAEQCPVGGGIIHLGATSSDALDNVDAMRLQASLDLLVTKLHKLLTCARERIEQWVDIPAMAFTHIQPAEPTTIGYRIAMYGQDWLMDMQALQRQRQELKGKGIKGAVGTGASYQDLLQGTSHTVAALEARVMARLGITAFPIAAQTMPRKQELDILHVLSGLASSLHKFALDSRLLQGEMLGEWREAFGPRQIGSSAMPFKRNPIMAENICSLARQIASQVMVAWQNHAHSMLERTLDDSGNRRLYLPEAFLLADEILDKTLHLLQSLQLNTRRIAATVAIYGKFAASERVLMAAAKAGGDRQLLHEILRDHSLAVWDEVQQGLPNRLPERLEADPEIRKWLEADRIRELMQVTQYVGDAPARARALATEIGDALSPITS